MSTHPQSNEHRTRWRLWPAAIAGCDLNVLAETPSDQTFFVGLGLVVLLLTIGSGLTMCLALSYMAGKPPLRVWWVAPGWSLLIMAIERQILMVQNIKRRWLPFSLMPRVGLALFIALAFGEPAVLWMNSHAINDQLTTVHIARVQAATNEIRRNYQPKIAAAQKQIAANQAAEVALKKNVIHNQELAECEAGEVACSVTHELGCKAVCHKDQKNAGLAQGELRTARTADRKVDAQLTSNIAGWQAAEKKQIKKRTRSINQDTDILAREEALSTIERKHPEVKSTIWVMRGFALFLDLTPLLAKVLHLLSGSPYELLLAARRRADGTRAIGLDEATRVEGQRIADQGSADIEVNRLRIDIDAHNRMAEAESAATGFTPADPVGDGAPIPAWTFRRFTDAMNTHEARAVDVDPELRRAGWVGTALISGLALALGVLSITTHNVVSGIWIVLLVLGLVAMFVGYTNGFRRAPTWGLRGIFATLLVGFLLPILIVALNI